MKDSINLERREAEDLIASLEALVEGAIVSEWVEELQRHINMLRDKLAGRIA